MTTLASVWYFSDDEFDINASKRNRYRLSTKKKKKSS